MKSYELRAWLLCIVMTLIFILQAVSANAQTPPISTVHTMQDTTGSMELAIHFSVASDVPWGAGGGVGVYWRVPGVTMGWNYAGGGYTSPIIWTAPMDDAAYEFATTVDNNLCDESHPENCEGYEFEPEATTYVCTTCIDCPDFPDQTVLGSLSFLVSNGYTSWGHADVPKERWWWFHSDCDSCSAPVMYQAEWKVGENVTVIDSIAVGDTTFAFVDVPTTPGQDQTIRVRAFDAAGHSSPFSLWAIPATDRKPGTPFQPANTLIMEEQ